MSNDRLTKNDRLALVASAFSPTAPVNDSVLFAEREPQLDACLDALYERGSHIALYGERGVGKTSLAIMLPQLIRKANLATLGAVRVDCNTNDTYLSVWRKVFKGLRQPREIAEGLEEPEDIRFALEDLDRGVLIVLDEYDRIDDDDSLSLLADTVKTLSDHLVDATIMFVGVADSLVALMGEHGSIVRSLVQVHMPRMSEPEMASVIDKGIWKAGLTIEDAARSRISLLSEGLPHYPHLLAKVACLRTVQDDRRKVTLADVDASMERAVDSHSMRDEFRKATQSPQPGHLFEEVLLACAFAKRDDLGYFRPADVRAPLSLLVGRSMDIPNFQRHLTELTGQKRGHTLRREGDRYSYRFRFANPLLQPYTKIRALAKALITEEQRERLEALR